MPPYNNVVKHLDLGKKSERVGVRFLKSNRHKILTQNFSSKWGEIDIVSKHRDTLVFTEVRSKHSEAFGTPEETVDIRKQARIRKTAEYYLHVHHLTDCACRFDVIAIVWQGKKPEIRYYEDAFR